MKIFGYILIVFTLLLTVFVGIKQPKMHTKIFVYNSDYEIVEENQTPSVETVKKTEELPSMPVENTESRIQVAMEEQETSVVKIEVKTVEQPKTTTQSKQNKTVTKQPQKTTVTKPVTKTTTQTKPNVTQTTQQKPQTAVQTQSQNKPVQTVQTMQTQPQQTQTQQTQPQQTQTVVKAASVPSTVKVLTAREEEIAWNVWRSNLQNKIMRDSRLPNIPIGTVFKVSFDVDKYGKITNLQTWSPDSRYTPYAIEYVAPVIKSFQGKPILDFPQGSQRTKTTFTGSWKIAQTSKYSTPGDYNDTERVIR